MKRASRHQYSRISSYEDFRKEKELLRLKGRIIDTRLSLSFMQLKQSFSPSNLLLSLAKKYILPEVANFLGGFSEKVTNTGDS